MKFKLRINGKMLLYILGTTVVVFVSALMYVAFKLRNNNDQNAFQVFKANAVEYSNTAQQKLDSYMESVSLLAETLSGYEKIPEENRREMVNNMIINLINKNTDYLSVYTIWNPNIIDSFDITDPSLFGNTPDGNFQCIYFRNTDSVRLKPFVESDSTEIQDYQLFNKIKKSLEPIVLEPFHFSNQYNLLQTKMVVPIINQNQFLGIAGIDVPLDYIQQAFSNIKPMGTGKVFIITHEGNFLAHPDTNLLGKSFTDYAPEIQTKFHILDSIQNGKPIEFEAKEPTSGNMNMFQFIPLKIGKTNTPWSICVTVPSETIYKTAKRAFNVALIIGLVGLILISLVILGIAFSISTPIVKATRIMQEISRGNIKNPEKISFFIQDEISDMAKAMDKLVDGLNSAAVFANQIGEGNLEVNYNLLSENDALGNSLISMQQSLKQAKIAEEKKRAEDEKRNWATHGLALFGEVIRQHNDDMDKFTMNITKNIVDYLDAAQVAIYINQQIEDESKENDIFELKAAVAYGKPVKLTKTFEKGQELLGRSAVENRIIYLEEIPERYVALSPGMQNKKRPTNLLIAPLNINDITLGVIELLSYNKIESYQIDFIEKLCENIASVVSSVKTNVRTENLLQQSQSQADELAQHEEEMRQNMEEMEATQEEANKRQDELKSYLKAIKGSIMMAELDIKGRILDISPAMSTVYGATLDNMRGKFYEAFVAHDKKTQNEFSDFWQALIRTRAGKRKQKVSQRNKEFWYLESYQVIEKEGLNPKVIIVVIDVTKDKELNDTLAEEIKKSK